MESASSNPITWRFGRFELDGEGRQLLENSQPVHIQQRPLQVLTLLLTQAPAVVSRELLTRQLWPDDAEVDREDALNAIVARLRRTLRDDIAEPQFVITVPGRGYRFIGLEDGAAAQAPPQQIAPDPKPRSWQRRVWTALAVAGLAGVGWEALQTPPQPRIVRLEDLTTSGALDFLAQPASDGANFYYLQREGGGWTLMKNAGEESAAVEVPDPLQARGKNILLLDVAADTGEWLIGAFRERGEAFELWHWRAPGGTPLRVGTVAADDAAWYPDGKRIVYGTHGRLWSVAPDGRDAREESSVGGGVLNWFSWSPDGSELRFSSDDAIWRWRPLDHAPAQRLGAAYPRCCGNWSHDGRYYLFSELRAGVWNLWAQRQVGRIWRFGRMPKAVQLSFEPRNVMGAYVGRGHEEVAFYQTDQREAPERMDLSKHAAVPLLGGRNASQLEYAPDGRHVAFVDQRDSTLWVADNAAGFQASNFRQLTLPGGVAAFPRWSPDGKWIAYTYRAEGSAERAWTVPSSGGAPEAVAVPPQFEHILVTNPDWSADGGQLLVGLVDQTPGRPEHYSLAIVDRQRATYHAVSGSDGLTAARWSPDGRWIAAYSNDQHQLEIYDVRRRQWQQIARGSAFSFPVWSRDGRYVYAQDLLAAAQPVVRYAVNTWRPEAVTDFSPYLQSGVHRAGFLSLAPDGSPVVAFNTGFANLRRAWLELP